MSLAIIKRDDLVLNQPQAQFLTSKKKFNALVAGFGSGKTFTGSLRHCFLAIKYPGIMTGYFAPTYRGVRDYFYPAIDKAAYYLGLKASIKYANSEVHLIDPLSKCIGVVKCRSMDNPDSIVGFEIAHGQVDEIDILNMFQADLAWNKIVARFRLKVEGYSNSADITTTPEGHKWTYKTFVKDIAKNSLSESFYGITRARTIDNLHNLPDDYIHQLLATYPKKLISAYINGEFVNLTTGSAYYAFDRNLNSSTCTIDDANTLHIGLDFNVNKMCGVVHIIKDNIPIAVDEIHELFDTPDVIDHIKCHYPNKNIVMYVDASGNSRHSSNAKVSDVSILRNAGFTVMHDPKNPAVRDRVNAMNGAFCNSKGDRKYLVNIDRCKNYVSSLEQLPLDKDGNPDKKLGIEHNTDGAGYFIHKRFPVKRTQFINASTVVGYAA